jgi:hypothetical protein
MTLPGKLRTLATRAKLKRRFRRSRWSPSKDNPRLLKKLNLKNSPVKVKRRRDSLDQLSVGS